MSSPGAGLSQAEICRRLSTQFRYGLSIYAIGELQIRFALILCLETYDQDIEVGKMNIEGWTKRLGMKDAKGWRFKNCRKLFDSLVELLMVDEDPIKATYRLRPDYDSWSKLCAFRSSIERAPEPELKLSAERPLSEALSDLSREKALESAGAPTVDAGALLTKLREALQRNASDQELDELAASVSRPANPAHVPVDRSGLGAMLLGLGTSAEKSADSSGNAVVFSAEKSADTLTVANVPENKGESMSAEKSADSRMNSPAALASLSSVQRKAKLAKAESAEKSADWSVRAAGAWQWLERIDETRALKEKWVRSQWEELCNRDPHYVLTRLRGAFEDHVRRIKEGDPALRPIKNPIAWIARKAWDEHMMQPLRT